MGKGRKKERSVGREQKRRGKEGRGKEKKRKLGRKEGRE